MWVLAGRSWATCCPCGGYPPCQPLSANRSALRQWTLCRQPKNEREITLEVWLGWIFFIVGCGKMSVRIFTYDCPRCRTIVPAKSRAKSRFDSFCPRCHRRVTIYWPKRRRSIWDDRRGRERVVGYRPYHSWAEAAEAAKQANFDLLQLRHRSGLFRFHRMDAGFIPASQLTAEEFERRKRELEKK